MGGASTANIYGDCIDEISLGQGLMSKMGFSAFDDSESMVFDENGNFQAHMDNHTDVYFLAYGRDYLGCLKDFYHMSGKTPLLPRYALGNWWSRYYSYTTDSYLELMNRFRDDKLPFAVSVFDMGWHLVNIDPKYGKGWTGYTWNKELIPDPKALMDELHSRGKHITLNVHPADGVRAHEEMYVDMAKELGVNYEKELPIPFDVSSKKFMDAYFKYLHHPNEDQGVDFWWIDWQQGSNTLTPGYDPLWVLNHDHFMDNSRNGKRPMTFSRFSGLGSHRYPIGFSGSTFITWESLDYQPYFTATASNVGYGWWSHDIGGHRNGYRDDELETRWMQFGVFSPIMRIHSSNETFTGREPWKFGAEYRATMECFIRLRHQLLPYTYTMNARAHYDDEPIIEPMYFHYPENMESYQVKNEYFFGSQLIVSPITAKGDAELKVGSVNTWLPDGLWFDFFTGVSYTGDRTIELFRPIDSIPVLAKAGGIVPLQALDDISDDTSNPHHLELHVFAGANGSFKMYEDDGETMAFEDGASATTEYVLDWDNKSFKVKPSEGDLSVIPSERKYTLCFHGFKSDAIDSISVNGKDAQFSTTYDEDKNLLTVEIGTIAATDEVTVTFADTTIPANPILSLAYEALNRAQIPFTFKERLYGLLRSKATLQQKLTNIRTMNLSENTQSLIYELLLANTEL
jgi:alpha-glucosidase (family GH31 glycosyl hydrolase)